MTHFILHVALFLVGLGIVIFLRPQDKENARTVVSAYVVGYTIRFLVIVLLHSFSSDGLFMLDDRGYDDEGSYLADLFPSLNLQEMTGLLPTQQVAYPLLVGFVYWLGGHSVLSAKLLNAFFGALLAPVLYWLAAELGGDDPALPRRVAWLGALFPFDIAWAGILLRDIILELNFTLILASTIAGVKRRSYPLLLCATALLYPMFYLRRQAILVLAGAALLAAIAWTSHKLSPGRPWLWFVGITTAAVTSLILFLNPLQNHFDLVWLFSIAVEQATLSADAVPLIFSPTLGFFVSLSRATVVYLLSPDPLVFWGPDLDFGTYLVYPGMYVTYALFPFFVFGLWKLIRALQPMRVFLVAAFCVHGAMAIYIFQSGTRQRVMTDGILLLCAAVAWPFREILAGKIRLIYAGLAVLALGWVVIRTSG